MVKLSELMKFMGGSPQFRITETDDVQSPSYLIYNQEDLMDDLAGMDSGTIENKIIRTKDKVRLLCEGDLIFSLISGKAAIVQKEHEGYLYTQNYIKLIPKSNIASEFFVYLLNEDRYIRKQFQIGLQGSMVLKYTLKQLKEIEIMHLPSLFKQKQIGEIYLKQLKVQALKQRVIDLETKILVDQLGEVIKL